MPTRNGMNISVGAENNVKQGLNSALNDVTSWSKKAGKAAIIEVKTKFNNTIFDEYYNKWEAAATKASNLLKKFQFDGKYTKNGKKKQLSFVGIAGELDYERAKNALSQLQSLRDSIDKGSVRSDSWTLKEKRNLDNLISNLKIATENYNNMLRAQKKSDTLKTSIAAQRAQKEENAEQQKQAQADALYRRRYIAFAQEQTKAEREASRAKVEEEKRKTRIQQEETRKRIRMHHEEQAAVRRATNARVGYDRSINRIVGGGNTNTTLANMRRFYNEQARTAERDAREEQAAVRLAAIRRKRANDKINESYTQQTGLLSRLRSLAASYFSIYAVAGFLRKLAEVTGFFERQQIALEGIVGSTAEANKLLNQIKSFSLHSPLEAKDLIAYTKQLAAYQIPTKELFNDMKMLADLSQGLGVSMDRLILAYGQVRSASVLRGQELRQFTEAGIPMVKKLAEKFSDLRGEMVTTADVFKLISERQVPFEMVAEILRDMTAEGGKFNNMQERLSETVYGQMQKIKDIWNQALDSMGKQNNGLLMGVIKAIQIIAKNINAIFKGAVWGGIIAMLGKVRIAWGQITKSIHTARVHMRAFHIAIIRSKGAMDMLKIAARGLIGILSAVGGVIIGAVVTAISAAREEARRFNQQLSEINRSFDNDIEKMSADLDKLHRKMSKGVGTEEYAQALSALKANYSEYITVSNDVIAVMSNEANSVDGLRSSYDELRDSIIGAIKIKKNWERGREIINAYGEVIAPRFAKKFSSYAAGRLPGILSKIFDPNQLQDIAEVVAENAITEMIENRETTYSQFYERFVNLLKDRVGDVEINEDFSYGFKIATKNLGSWKKYLKEVENFNSSPSNRAFERINELFDSITPTGKDDFDRAINGHIKALKSLRTILTEKDGIFGNNKANRTTLLDSIDEAINDFDYPKLERIIRLLSKFKDSLNADKKSYAELLMGRYEEFNPAIGERAAIVRERIRKNAELSDSSFAKELLKNLNEENYESYRNSAKQKKQDVEAQIATYLKDALKQNYKVGDEKKDADWILRKISEKDKGTVANLIKNRDYAKILMGTDYLAIGEEKSKTSSGRDRTYKAITDLSKLIKTGYESQKKVIALTGNGAAFSDFVTKRLDSSNILRRFWEAANDDTAANPFADYLADLAKEGIKTDKFKSIFSYLNQDVLIDFERIWRDMMNAVSDRLEEVRKQEGIEGPNARRLEELYARLAEEQLTYFGKEEIGKRIEEAIQQLANINANTQKQVDVYNSMSELAKSMGYSAVNRLFGNGNENIFFSELSRLYGKQMAESLSLEDQSGFGEYLKRVVGDDELFSAIKAGKTNINNLKSLMEILENISTPENGEVEYFTKVRKDYVEIMKKLIDALKKEAIEAAGLASADEKTKVEFENIQKRLEEAKKVIDNSDIISDKSRASIEAVQSAFDEASKLLGGNGNQSWAERLFGSDKSSSGVGLIGNFMQYIVSAFDGDKIGLREMIANSAASGKMSVPSAGNSLAAIALVDSIVRAINAAINSILELSESVLKLQESMNSVVVRRDFAGRIETDENGNIKAAQAQSKERISATRKTLEIVSTFNKHAVDAWDNLISGNLLGVVTSIVTGIVDLIRQLNEMADMKYVNQIEKLQDEIDRIDRRIGRIRFDQEFMTQSEVLASRAEEIASLYEQQIDLQKQAEAEAKRKNADADKIQEYEDASVEKAREATRIAKGIRDEIIGTSDDLSSRLTDALVEAFKNGDNAARSMANNIKEYLGDVLKKQLIERAFSPVLKRIQDEFLGATEEQLAMMAGNGEVDDYYKYINTRMSETNVKKFASSLANASTTMIDFLNNLNPYLKDLITFNSQTTALRGGIESVTEDTARRSEAIMNSQLGELIMLRTLSENYFSDNRYIMADIQTSVARIGSNTSIIAEMSRSINKHIESLRTTSSQPLHVRID